MRRLLVMLVLLVLCASPAMAVEVYTATGAGAVDESLAFGSHDVVIMAIVFGMDGDSNTAENLVITNGANADATFYDADFDTESSLVWLDMLAPILSKTNTNETLDITFTNTDANTWTLHVYYDIVRY